MDALPLEIGVDEAGRGAVLGPLVLAACGLTPQASHALAAAGVTDSKAFGPPAQAQARRAALAEQIRRDCAWCAVIAVSPAQVDAAVRKHRLNALERTVAARLLDRAPAATRLVFDGARLFGALAARLRGAEALNQADRTCTAVAAASILAKTERDRLFGEIRAQYEPRFGPVLGEGYPNAATARFLEQYWHAQGTLPPETRRSWGWSPVADRVAPDERGEPPTFDFS